MVPLSGVVQPSSPVNWAPAVIWFNLVIRRRWSSSQFGLWLYYILKYWNVKPVRRVSGARLGTQLGSPFRMLLRYVFGCYYVEKWMSVCCGRTRTGIFGLYRLRDFDWVLKNRCWSAVVRLSLLDEDLYIFWRILFKFSRGVFFIYFNVIRSSF